MEALSSVGTILGIAQDILAAVETASRNKSRCGKLAKRVRCLRDMLQQLDTDMAQAAGTTDALERLVLERLEEALGDSLRLVRRCQRSTLLRSLTLASGGGRMADPLDEVEGDINRCILDLAVASYVRIARLETTLLRQQNEAVVDRVSVGSGAEKDAESTPADVPDEDVTAIGVPVCAVTAAAAGMHEHEHQVVPPPPSYGYGYGNCWHDNSGGPCDATSGYSHHYSYSYPYPSMFSDDNPNACSIT